MRSSGTITVRGLGKSYGSTPVLDGVDISVGEGEIFALLGPNGAGKTTTINILTTLLKADAGSVTIAGNDLAKHPDRVRASIGLTGQYAAVDPFQSGDENLMMMCRLAHLGRRAARRRTAELLTQFDLVDAAGRRAGLYSGGMRRRLDLAISLIARPAVVFLDEPTTGLDPRSRAQMWDVVRDLAANGTTILLTTQYLEEADQLADRIAVLDGGRIIAEGTPAELKAGLDGDHVEIVFADGRTERVATAHPVATIRELLADASDVESIAVVKPTLDDVFLALTGHQASETKKEEVAA